MGLYPIKNCIKSLKYYMHFSGISLIRLSACADGDSTPRKGVLTHCSLLNLLQESSENDEYHIYSDSKQTPRKRAPSSTPAFLRRVNLKKRYFTTKYCSFKLTVSSGGFPPTCCFVLKLHIYYKYIVYVCIYIYMSSCVGQ